MSIEGEKDIQVIITDWACWDKERKNLLLDTNCLTRFYIQKKYFTFTLVKTKF